MSEPATLTIEQARQLENANRLKTEFIANVSHELRTPLHAIVGYVELLEDGIYGSLTDEQAQTIRYIHDSARDLLDLVNNLLDLSRIEGGRTDLILSSFDVRELISELAVQLKPLADAKHIVVRSHVHLTSPVVRSDRSKLKQILTNVVGNAVKFTDSGAVTVRVAAAIDERGAQRNRVQISVEDTGIGIPPETLNRIFEKFYQVDSTPSRSHEGTGLGLYISKQLTELLGGTIRVESLPGKGTTVTLTVPINFEAVEGIHRLRKKLDAATVNSVLSSANNERLVLVISQNADVARILTDGLGSSDYRVVTVPANSEAALRARQLRPLIILLNAEEAASDFWTVFQELKSHADTRDVPTVFLGQGANQGLGASLRVSAPLNRQDLLRSIRATVNAGKNKVLIVEDDTSFREILAGILTAEGYRVSEANTGRQAIEKCAAERPDLILLDLHIPEIDGWGVIRHLTQCPDASDTEVLVISGDRPSAPEAAALQSQAAGYICKADFKVDAMLEKVANLLEVS
jgi:CheY-like chemotaxis protein/nitrogen-specific signal transduction histidine kinase